MLLEIENQLHKRVHSALGQSAVVLRLAEELDQSGRVAEQAMIIVSFTSANTNNPNKGAYIPTVRTRRVNYTLTLVQKQAQREGHSFCLPILDLLADSVTGWVPEVPGLEFQTGFELENEKFIQVTKESSQFIYEQNYSIEVLIVDGRFYSQPCAAFGPLNVSDLLPERKCLVTPDNRPTGLAVWRRNISPDETKVYVVQDENCCKRLAGDNLSVQCNTPLDGTGTYVFIPRTAVNNDGTVDQSKIFTGQLENIWKCTKEGQDREYPPSIVVNLDTGIWRNTIGTIPNTNPDTSALQSVRLGVSRQVKESSP